MSDVSDTRNVSLDLVLKVVQGMEPQERADYLVEHYPLLKKKVEAFINADSCDDDSPSFDFSFITSNLATQVVQGFEPEVYIGSIFGDFEAKKLIAVTARSAVFIGQPVSGYHQDVAIKVVAPVAQVGISAEHNLMQAERLESLKHPNLVEVKLAGVNDKGVGYLVMEYLSEQNILEHCKNKALSLNERLELFSQVLGCVAYIHSKLALHRDLKPDNILIDRHGIPKVIDLDLSEILEPGRGQGKYSHKSVGGFSSYYVSPEQLISPENASVASDIYSLGVVLKELLTHDKTLNIKAVPARLDDNFKHQWRHKEIVAIIDKATQPTESERYRSVADFANDISSYQHKRQIASAYKSKASIGYQLRHFLVRNKRAMLFVMFTFSLLFTFLIQTLIEKNNYRQALQAYYKTLDPRNKSEATSFRINAQELMKGRKWYQSTADYFEELVRVGDAYIGQGKPESASKFFKEAQELYSETYDENRIMATERLAESYFYYGASDKVIAEITPYASDIFVEGVSNPDFIGLLNITAKVEGYSLGKQFESSGYSDADILRFLSKIDLSQIENEQQKRLLEIRTLINETIFEYFSWHRYVETWSDEYKQRMTYIRKKLIRALRYFDEYELPTYLKASTHLWLGTVEAKLGVMNLATANLNKGLKLTEDIFGIFHPQTLNAQRRVYAGIFRADYLGASQLVEEMYEAYTAIEPTYVVDNHVLLYIFMHNKVAMGDHVKAKELYKLILKQDIFNLEDIEYTQGYYLSSIISEYLVTFHEKSPSKIPVLRELVEIDQALDRLSNKVMIDGLFSQIELNALLGNHELAIELINKAAEILESGEEEHNSPMWKYLYLAYLCSYTQECEPLPIYAKAEEHFDIVFSKVDVAADSFQHMFSSAALTLAQMKLLKGDIEMTEYYINFTYKIIMKLPNVDNSIHLRYTEVKAELAVYRKAYNEAVALYKSALFKARSLYGHSSFEVNYYQDKINQYEDRI